MRLPDHAPAKADLVAGGRSPKREHLRRRKKATAAAGLGLMHSGRVTEVFKLFNHNMNREDFFHWLVEVHEHYHRKPIVVWDNLQTELKAASAFRDLEVDWTGFQQLPSYAPDLSPPEGLWRGARHHSMANGAAADCEDLKSHTRRELQRRKWMPNFLKSCFVGAGLSTTAK